LIDFIHNWLLQQHGSIVCSFVKDNCSFIQKRYNKRPGLRAEARAFAIVVENKNAPAKPRRTLSYRIEGDYRDGGSSPRRAPMQHAQQQQQEEKTVCQINIRCLLEHQFHWLRYTSSEPNVQISAESIRCLGVCQTQNLA
jgi:hypothetical protein